MTWNIIVKIKGSTIYREISNYLGVWGDRIEHINFGRKELPSKKGVPFYIVSRLYFFIRFDILITLTVCSFLFRAFLMVRNVAGRMHLDIVYEMMDDDDKFREELDDISDLEEMHEAVLNHIINLNRRMAFKNERNS